MDKKILWIVLVCIFRTTLSQFPTGEPTGGPTGGCNADEFKCDTTDECFTFSWKCDGIVDCSDGSDESDCPATNGPPTGGPPTGGPHTGGPHTGGPHTGGPHTGGPHTGGPHTGGPHTGGPHTGGPPTGVPPCGDSTPNPTGGPTGTCNADEFKCDTTDQCFTLAWKCDGIVDCSDDSDEKDCPDQPSSTALPTGGPTGTCNADEFKCDATDQCFTLAWKCDGIVDCSDDSDEKDCPDQPSSTALPTGGPTGTCNADEFKCDTTDQCFTLAWKCDGIVDCSDNSDEKDCPDQPSSTALPTGGPTVPPTGGPTGGCNADEFKCATTDQCFPSSWKCDGIEDCSDDSDEAGCPATNGPPTGGPPTSGPSGCGSDNGKCDGYADCADGSDEQGCDTFTCPANKEKCGNGQKDRLICILKSAFCDGYQDCPDGGDENEDICKARTCDAGEIRCPEGACLPASAKCNGWPECSNGADEVGCTGCPGSGRRCADGKMCVEGSAFCDGMLDCPDQSDEANCGGGPSKRGMLYRRFERLLHQLRSRERRSAPKTVAQRALKAMEDARHKMHMSALNRRRMVTSRRQSRTDTRGLQSIRRKLRERKIHRAKLEKLAERNAAMARREQRRSHQG